ncbi:MAG TPA: sigma-70 family RNA polymerase sigma factor [Rhizomicrobium sp.]|nr:sigma-70 family RNA polymerase sigma factor [Rhizomicrobium sp.]
MTEPLDDEAARALRGLWFRYLDTIAAIRPRLYRCCLKLTGSIFDAEDLLQDTLLKGFGAIGSGIFANQPVADARAYLCRIATNSWIDAQRRKRRAEVAATEVSGESETKEAAMVTSAATAALFERTAPQERAAIVLKDVFDFSLKEIADLLTTSEGAVKAALHRGREKLDEKRDHAPPRHVRASAALIDAFDAAFRARDIDAITALLMESTTYEVQGVGWEIGTKGAWLQINLGNLDIDGVRIERRMVDGEWCGCGIYKTGDKEYLVSLVRYEESDGKIARIINYAFCPDTLVAAAAELGLKPPRRDYHQDPETLVRMIDGMRVPWQTTTHE